MTRILSSRYQKKKKGSREAARNQRRNWSKSRRLSSVESDSVHDPRCVSGQLTMRAHDGLPS
jgi:uncharacterized protein